MQGFFFFISVGVWAVLRYLVDFLQYANLLRTTEFR